MPNLHIKTRFGDSGVSPHLHSDTEIVASGTLIKGLYTLYTTPNTIQLTSETHETALVSSLNVRDRRIAHANMLGILSMVTSSNSANRRVVWSDTSQTNIFPLSVCLCAGKVASCHNSKNEKLPLYEGISNRTSHVLSPVEVQSLGAYATLCQSSMSSPNVPSDLRFESIPKYYNSLISSKRWQNITRTVRFRNFMFMSFGSIADDTEHLIQLNSGRSYNGVEYLSGSFKHFLAAHGIEYPITVAYTPYKTIWQSAWTPSTSASFVQFFTTNSFQINYGQRLSPLPCMCETVSRLAPYLPMPLPTIFGMENPNISVTCVCAVPSLGFYSQDACKNVWRSV